MKEAEGWTARQVREEVGAEGVVHHSDGRDEAVLVENLSDDGCCIIGTYRIGETVELSIPGRSRMECQVRWAIGGRSGLRIIDEESGS